MAATWALACWAGVVGAQAPAPSDPSSPRPASDTATAAGTTQTAPAVTPLEVVEQWPNQQGALAVRLSNQLVVIIKPLRAAPVVSVRGYVRAGGLYEGKYLGAGISHLVEHLVAEGVEQDASHGSRQAVSQQIKEVGGQSNAYTSLDHTCYHISAGAGKVMQCVDLVAQWLVKPVITEEQFHRQQGVVSREIETSADLPARRFGEAAMGNYFGDHPAAVPVIGYAPALRALSYQDVLDYHGRMYVPRNMVLVVVGDVDPKAVLDRVRVAFAPLEPARTPDLALPAVQPLAGVRRVVRPFAGITDAMERIDFRSINLLDDDLYALDVLSYVLSNGPSSRLVQRIRREQSLVTTIDSSSWTPSWGVGPFSVEFRCPPGKADAAEAAILEQLRLVREEPISDAELERAKRQKVADFVYAQETAESQAATLASDYLSTGELDFSDRYTRRIQDVTAQQVQAVARKYLDPARMAVTRMVSQAAAEQAASTQTSQPAATEVFRLPNGLRVILRPTDAVGVVSMALVTEGGLLRETPATNGLGMLMTRLSTQGAGERTAEDIAAFFDAAGGAISGSCGNNSFFWQATVLADRFAPAMEILSDVVCRPTFPAKELDILRPVLLAAIDRIDEDWNSQLQKFFRSMFWPLRDTPYRMLSIGTKDVVSAATIEQIREHYGQSITANNSVLAVYGKFDPAAARAQIERLFAQMATGELISIKEWLWTVDGPGASQFQTLKTDKELAAVIVATPLNRFGMRVKDVADRLPMDVLDTIISGYQMPAGWLHDELRGKQLVYVVHAYNWVGLAPGAFVTYAACQPDKAQEVIQIIQADLDKAADYTPTQAEIDEAVNTILTAELLGNQSMSALAMSAALDELYGLGWDFRSKMEQLYRQVTPQDVHRVGQTYLARPRAVFLTSPAPELVPPQDATGEPVPADATTAPAP
jgi:zinc protease